MQDLQDNTTQLPSSLSRTLQKVRQPNENLNQSRDRSWEKTKEHRGEQLT
jgi:hypothetical protein